MKTVIIGGNGFLGRALLPYLQATNRDVLVIGRSARPKDLDPNIPYIQSDCCEMTAQYNSLKNAEEIIDFSYTSTPKTSFDDPMSDLTSNLPRAVSIFEICKKLSHLQRLIVVSSGGTVYGKVRQYPIKESTLTKPISPYGITKLTIEKYAHLYHELYDLPVIIARPANAYGPKKKVKTAQGFINVSLSKILQNQEIPVFGDIGTVRDYVYSTDLAQAFIALLSSGKIGKTYNVGTGIGINNVELLTIIRKIVKKDGYNLTYTILPTRPFDVPINVLDSTVLHNDTGWVAQTTLEKGLQATWDYMLQQQS